MRHNEEKSKVRGQSCSCQTSSIGKSTPREIEIAPNRISTAKG